MYNLSLKGHMLKQDNISSKRTKKIIPVSGGRLVPIEDIPENEGKTISRIGKNDMIRNFFCGKRNKMTGDHGKQELTELHELDDSDDEVPMFEHDQTIFSNKRRKIDNDLTKLLDIQPKVILPNINSFYDYFETRNSYKISIYNFTLECNNNKYTFNNIPVDRKVFEKLFMSIVFQKVTEVELGLALSHVLNDNIAKQLKERSKKDTTRIKYLGHTIEIDSEYRLDDKLISNEEASDLINYMNSGDHIKFMRLADKIKFYY